jgi:hypothetical protein
MGGILLVEKSSSAMLSPDKDSSLTCSIIFPNISIYRYYISPGFHFFFLLSIACWRALGKLAFCLGVNPYIGFVGLDLGGIYLPKSGFLNLGSGAGTDTGS